MNPLCFFFFNGYTILFFYSSVIPIAVLQWRTWIITQLTKFTWRSRLQLFWCLDFFFFCCCFLCFYWKICFRNIKIEKKEVMKDSQGNLLQARVCLWRKQIRKPKVAILKNNNSIIEEFHLKWTSALEYEMWNASAPISAFKISQVQTKVFVVFMQFK